jgi:hypothetical protein
MTGIAKAFADMRESGGDPYGVLCAATDRAAMEVYGVPVRVSHYVPAGQGYVVDRKTWHDMEHGPSLLPVDNLRWEDM